MYVDTLSMKTRKNPNHNETTVMSLVAGFKVIPIISSKESNHQHELFVKENSARAHSTDKPLGRTLFVLNVPPYITEASLKNIFSIAGPVQSVNFQTKLYSKDGKVINKRCGFKVSYVVFKELLGLANALKLKSLPPLSANGQPVLLGIRKWLNNYNKNICNHRMLQKNVDSFMKKYDKQVEQQKRKESKEITDDEGWTVVTKTGRNPVLSSKNTVHNQESFQKKKKVLRNFYTFQIREAQMNNLAMLRKKYEEDKKKVAAMRQARKFKPF